MELQSLRTFLAFILPLSINQSDSRPMGMEKSHINR